MIELPFWRKLSNWIGFCGIKNIPISFDFKSFVRLPWPEKAVWTMASITLFSQLYPVLSDRLYVLTFNLDILWTRETIYLISIKIIKETAKLQLDLTPFERSKRASETRSFVLTIQNIFTLDKYNFFSVVKKATILGDMNTIWVFMSQKAQRYLLPFLWSGLTFILWGFLRTLSAFSPKIVLSQWGFISRIFYIKKKNPFAYLELSLGFLFLLFSEKGQQIKWILLLPVEEIWLLVWPLLL